MKSDILQNTSEQTRQKMKIIQNQNKHKIDDVSWQPEGRKYMNAL